MNPIIKLLAEQAGMNIKTNISGVGLVFGTFEGYKTSHVSVEELEKFAKLLVRECIGVVEAGSFLHAQAPVAIFAKGCSGAIKRHFGVEP